MNKKQALSLTLEFLFVAGFLIAMWYFIGVPFSYKMVVLGAIGAIIGMLGYRGLKRFINKENKIDEDR